MIISHSHKFIFVKTQKTASTSMEIALSALCDKNDIVTPITLADEKIRQKLGYSSPQNYRISFSKYTLQDLYKLFTKGTFKTFYNHISCEEIQAILGKKTYNDYYKFCFERNPYDKAISLFFHEGGYNKWQSIEQFIRQGGLKKIKGYDQYTIGKTLAVDAIFKFEDMETALQTISEKLNLKDPLKLPDVKLKSGFRKDTRSYTEVLTETEKQLIDTIWARERVLMGYTF